MIYNRPEYWMRKEEKPREAFLTFSSPNAFSISAPKDWDGLLEYSTDKTSWTEWDGSEISSASLNGEHVLYLSGTGNTKITGASSSTGKWSITGTDIKCSGDIDTILDYATVEDGKRPAMADYCYNSMFQGCTSLTQAPALPATTLADSCYSYMFYGCTSLTQSPALPATTLEDYCYMYMFDGCTSLTQAPALPATTLAAQCYHYMFYGCTSLTQAPALPATTLASRCYDSMFQGCKGLTQAPDLPATTLATYCYQYMFQGCTSLTQAPALPATTLANYCYSNMFSGCKGLTQAPSLPATTLAKNCYNSMFRNCTKIKLSSTKTGEYTKNYRIPTSGAGTTATNALSSMFTGTGGTFKATPSVNTTYYLSNTNTIV